ncbi:T9SS type A sorting domain-containing protein [Polaribacter litorisediminis]|nr:T9SS type A sorting domain-containing protein [Polaribacter litorisediminis]
MSNFDIVSGAAPFTVEFTTRGAFVGNFFTSNPVEGVNPDDSTTWPQFVANASNVNAQFLNDFLTTQNTVVYNIIITDANGCRQEKVYTLVVNPEENPDYEITTTDGNLVIIDISGNGDTLTVSEEAGNIVFNATDRIYRSNGASIGSLPISIPMSGLTSIEINGAGGDDVIEFDSYFTNMPSLTVNGGAGNDKVYLFGSSITFAENANLNIDLTDDASDGDEDWLDMQPVSNNIISGFYLKGTGTATFKVSKNISLGERSSIATENGALYVEANATGLTPGNFKGVELVNISSIRSTGTGQVTVKGTGGTTASNNWGVSVSGGSIYGGTTGTLLVEGTGGASAGNTNIGVYSGNLGGAISSLGAAVVVNGTGGGIEASTTNTGVVAGQSGGYSSAGTLTITGTGGSSLVTSDQNSSNNGISIQGGVGSLTSTGAIMLIGTKGANSSQGVDIYVTGAGSISNNGSISLTSLTGGFYPNYLGLSVQNASANQVTKFETGSKLNFYIGGPTRTGATAGQYFPLQVSGLVDLNNVELTTIGGYTPQAGNEFLVVVNDGTDAVQGKFTYQGVVLNQGDEVPNFKGSSATFYINYQGGDGNDVVITSNFTLIPDPNFEQALLDLDIDSDGIINGKVRTSDIAVVTELNIASKGISDLTGIEGFINLETLYCQFNTISALDFSTNLKLTYVQADNNNLASLNVTNNIELTTLGCGANQLTSLDVSKNTKLILLTVDENNLSTINITNLVNLEHLGLRDNNFTSVNISKNINLIYVYIKNNSLTGLDVTNNKNLQYLDASFNNFINFDINQNVNLKTLFLNNNNIERAYLRNGANTLITDFDIRNNPDLTCIAVDDVAFSETNWINKDTSANYNTDCNAEWTIYTTDANLDAAVLAIPSLDIDGDGKVTYEEAQAFTGDLNFSGQNIATITGLEAFTNAGSIDISNNVITSINSFLSASSVVLISKSTKQTKSLARAKNKVRKLNVSGNLITEINISNLTDITDLDARNNRLTTLNLKNANNAILIKLDVTNNPNLGCIEVDNVEAALAKTGWEKDATATYSMSCNALSIDNFLKENVAAYPNPASSFVEILLSNGLKLKKVEVFNATGKRLNTTNNTILNVEELSAGVYFIKITTDKGAINKRIVKD